MYVLLFLCSIALYFLYKWSTSTFDHFAKLGIPFRKPVPLLGTQSNFITKKKSFIESLQGVYYEFRNEKVSGLFDFRSPTVMVRDPKIVKQMAVKDFDHFMDHRVIFTEDHDPMFGKAIISLKGQKWKDMRSTLSPAFTGSKMRQMFDFVNDVGSQAAKEIRNKINNGGENAYELKALAMRITVDVIATCAFGIEVNSLKNPDNDFHRIATKLTDFTSVKTGFKLVGYLTIPAVMKELGISLFDKESCDFFQEIILDAMKIREEKGIIRYDMINLLLQAKKGQLSHSKKEADEETAEGFATVQESEIGQSEVKRKWDDADLVAQCFVFFLGGFETVATTMSFMAYELVTNPDVQQKLYEEIRDMNQELDGQKVTYENIQGMKYLDQTVSETLRKWPPAPAFDRICVKDYELRYDDKVLPFKPNNLFYVPVWCFHHDPEYFPEPEKFDPDRFSEENRGNIDPDTYLPFGIGPRNCIGSRFALMELKTIFYYLLLNFSFEVTDKTQIPLKLQNIPFALKPEKGIWVALKPRE